MYYLQLPPPLSSTYLQKQNYFMVKYCHECCQSPLETRETSAAFGVCLSFLLWAHNPEASSEASFYWYPLPPHLLPCQIHFGKQTSLSTFHCLALRQNRHAKNHWDWSQVVCDDSLLKMAACYLTDLPPALNSAVELEFLGHYQGFFGGELMLQNCYGFIKGSYSTKEKEENRNIASCKHRLNCGLKV